MKDSNRQTVGRQGMVPSLTFLLAVKESGLQKEFRMRSTSSLTCTWPIISKAIGASAQHKVSDMLSHVCVKPNGSH